MAKLTDTQITLCKCTRFTTLSNEFITLFKNSAGQIHCLIQGINNPAAYICTPIRILAKGYLPISLITPSKLREILSDVKIAVRKTNPGYDFMIDRLHLYYNMQLVTFGIDKDKNVCSTHIPMECPPVDAIIYFIHIYLNFIRLDRNYYKNPNWNKVMTLVYTAT